MIDKEDTNIQQIIKDHTLSAFNAAVESAVCRIIKERFNVDSNNTTELSEIISKKKLKIVLSVDGSFLGVSSNNRWLYTIDGKVIGLSKSGFISKI